MKRSVALFLGILSYVIVCSAMALQAANPMLTIYLPRTVYLPHLTGGPAGADWTDYLQADNNGADPASFTLDIYDGNSGTPIFTKSFMVPGRSKLLIDIKKEATSLGSTGVITYYTDSALGFRLSYEYKTGGLAEFYLTDRLKTSMVLYFSDFSKVITTKGVAVANMTGKSETVTMYAVGGGQILGQTQFSLPPFARTVGGPSTYFGGIPGIDAAVEKLIIVAESACLDGLTIGTDATLAHSVFIPGQEALGFVPPGSELFSVFEDFNSNGNGWDLTNTKSVTSSISSGFFNLDVFGSDSWHYWLKDFLAGLNESQNFTIETKITLNFSSAPNFYGLTWGLLDLGNYFDFTLDDGSFGIWRRTGGKWFLIADGSQAAINKGVPNTNILKIRKIGSTLYFYINNTEVHSMPYMSFYGNNVGFHVYGDQGITIDYLSITQDP